MKTQHRRTVVAIDDDEINLMILTKCAQDAGFDVRAFESAREGLEHMRTHPGEVDIVLLDKMMPDMNGIEMLQKLKHDKATQYVPVILQTGDVGVPQMREGLENGAHYYLTKPFHPEMLAAVLHSAAQECEIREELLRSADANHSRFIMLMHRGEFFVQTPQEANRLAVTLSQLALYPEFVAVGLMELLNNAIEHGNLAFGDDQKNEYLAKGKWSEMLEKRLADPAYSGRKVRVFIERGNNSLEVEITDQGQGFDWQAYVYGGDPLSGAPVLHGRGISKALIMLDNVQYHGDGNCVTCNIPLVNGLN